MEKTAIIVGSGLVGSLAANYMAKRGYRVELYEKREDGRKTTNTQGRSINLALSNRARRALSIIGLEEEVLKSSVPMKGRLIHSLEGNTKSIPYDNINKQCLYSISRNFLNTLLIKALDNNPKIQTFFKHKFINTDFEAGIVSILNLETNKTVQSHGDIIIGADGAYSNVRREIQRTSHLTYSQTYIEHGYIELSIQPEEGARMIPNHLHIWPRGTFMMIALPNLDGSWTVTLFMPFDIFATLSSEEKLIDFFKCTFPDYLDFCSEQQLVRDFFSKKPMALISIKCEPYNFGKVVLIGDAAHAMVPFYGQGLNAGFEDCFLLNKILNETRDDIKLSLEMFTKKRRDDAHAICDLAMYNYIEMRYLVTKPTYKLRKKFDEFMFGLMPNVWIPLYNSVTFSKMGYKQCVVNRNWQDKVIKWCGVIITMTIIPASAYLSYNTIYD